MVLCVLSEFAGGSVTPVTVVWLQVPTMIGRVSLVFEAEVTFPGILAHEAVLPNPVTAGGHD